MNIIVALRPEAKPLIDHFGLKQTGATEFAGDHIRLSICGMGQSGINVPDSLTCLNIGIAGHASLPVGTPVMADAVVDAETGVTIKTHVPEYYHGEVRMVKTVPEPENHYRDDFVYDMEAAGIVTAMGGSVQVLKIISDNLTSPASRLGKQMIRELISENMKLIDEVVQHG